MNDDTVAAAKRITRFLESRGVSLRENESKTGISRFRLARMARGQTAKELTNKEIQNICYVYSIRPEYIIDGILPVTEDVPQASHRGSPAVEKPQPTTETRVGTHLGQYPNESQGTEQRTATASSIQDIPAHLPLTQQLELVLRMNDRLIERFEKIRPGVIDRILGECWPES